jgi:hypothetical protein
MHLLQEHTDTDWLLWLVLYMTAALLPWLFRVVLLVGVLRLSLVP